MAFVLIPCEVSPGCFPSERAVSISLEGAEPVSLFADASLIRTRSGRSYLKATRMGFDFRHPGRAKIALLHEETFEAGRWLRVRGRRVSLK